MKKLFFFISLLLITSHINMIHSEVKETYVLMETSMGKVKIKSPKASVLAMTTFTWAWPF